MLRSFFLFCCAVFIFSSCGPAAEDREAMHRNAKRFQDSIANYINNRLQEAESAPAMQQPANDTAAMRRQQQQQQPPRPGN
jgi:hypothetical protein